MRLSSFGCLAFLYVGSSWAKECRYSLEANTQSNADSIESCSTISDITINNDEIDKIEFSGIQEVTGNLTIKASNLTSFSAPKLETVGGTLRLENTTSLKNLDLSSLSSVGSLIWYKSASDLKYSFPDDGLTTVANATILQTAIKSLDWLRAKTVDSVYVIWNEKLATIDFPYLKNFTGILSVAPDDSATPVQFPALISGRNLHLGNGVSSVDIGSLQSLAILNLSETSITNFTAPELTKLETIGLESNDHLADFNMPKLETLSNINFTDWDIGTNFSFPVLREIEENATFWGNISEIKFPQIEHIYGTFNVSGFNFNNTMSCPTVRARYLKYTYQVACDLVNVDTQGSTSGLSTTDSMTNSSNAAPTTSQPASTTTSGSTGNNPGPEESTVGNSDTPGSMSPGTKAGIAIGAVVGTLFITGIGVFIVLRRRKLRAQIGNASAGKEAPGNQDPAEVNLVSGDLVEAPVTHRVEAPGTRREMAVELEHKHVAELE